jgi:hypothetical protein
MTTEQIETVAAEHFYVNQLVSLKLCFGHQAKIGCLVEGGRTVRCGTIAELVKLGWVPAKYAYLDEFLPSLNGAIHD